MQAMQVVQHGGCGDVHYVGRLSESREALPSSNFAKSRAITKEDWKSLKSINFVIVRKIRESS